MRLYFDIKLSNPCIKPTQITCFFFSKPRVVDQKCHFHMLVHVHAMLMWIFTCYMLMMHWIILLIYIILPYYQHKHCIFSCDLNFAIKVHKAYIWIVHLWYYLTHHTIWVFIWKATCILNDIYIWFTRIDGIGQCMKYSNVLSLYIFQWKLTICSIYL